MRKRPASICSTTSSSKNIRCASRRRRRNKLQTTAYAIEEVLKACGMSFRDIERWGGKVMEGCP